MAARDYFEGVRAEVLELRRAQDMLERLRSRCGIRAQGYETATSGGTARDAMDDVVRVVDFESRLELRIRDCEDEVSAACDLLYGKDNKGGLAKLKGTRYADAICMAYLQVEEWSDIAEIMQCSPKWCRELCNAGFAYIDKVGWGRIREA